jgi:hypothetical protein
MPPIHLLKEVIVFIAFRPTIYSIYIPTLVQMTRKLGTEYLRLLPVYN